MRDPMSQIAQAVETGGLRIEGEHGRYGMPRLSDRAVHIPKVPPNDCKLATWKNIELPCTFCRQQIRKRCPGAHGDISNPIDIDVDHIDIDVDHEALERRG
jgi:hypothetical protein